MAGVHRDAIRKLLGKGSLSGFEVAKIILADLWEAEHVRDSILSENEMRVIRNRINDPRESSVKNDWLGAFGTICEVNHTAHIIYLNIQTELSTLESILEKYLTSAFVNLQMRFMPTIVTQKQLEDLRDDHRGFALREKHSLEWVIFSRADELLSEEDVTLESLLEREPEQAVRVYRQACREIRNLIESGRLKFTHQKNTLKLLERIETAKPDREVLAIIDGTLSAEPKLRVERPERFLEKATTSGEALYQAGLPEWVKSVDEYQHDSFGGVAVIQNPCCDDLDDKGHYIDHGSLFDYYPFQPPGDDFWNALDVSPQVFFNKRLEMVKFVISGFLFFRLVMKVLSDKTGIGFSDDVDYWYRSLGHAIKSYEETMQSTVLFSLQARKDLADIPLDLAMDELQPSPGLETLMMNRLNRPLMKSQWLQDCKDYYLKEKLSGFPRAELADLLSGMGREARKRIYGLLKSNDRPGITS